MNYGVPHAIDCGCTQSFLVSAVAGEISTKLFANRAARLEDPLSYAVCAYRYFVCGTTTVASTTWSA